MSYTDVHEPLSFEGIHVAVLAGDNGHGKSALLDAITWALWGRARGRSVDELIHAGASEMEVEFEFILDEQQYRVLRKRQRRGRYGTSLLDFFVMSPDGYRALTERSQAETERLIERTLRMSYETFTSSSFIQQGRADSFTISSPAERKRILAEILELGVYDELEARAKERFKDSEARLADERRLAQDWEQEIARKPEYQAELDRLRAELAVLEERSSGLESQCILLRERVAGLEAIQQQVQELQTRIQRLAAERVRLTETLSERRSLHEQAAQVLARGPAIERAAAELDEVKKQLEVATERQQRFLPLERTREEAVRSLAAEQARLEGEVAQREKRVAELRQVAERLSALQVELRRAQQEAATLSQLEGEHRQLQATLGTVREVVAEKRTVNTQLKKEMLELRQRMDSLEQLSTCPTCRRPMDADHKQQLRSEYQSSGAQLRDQFRAHEADYRELEARVTRDEAQLAHLAAQLTERDAIHRQVVESEGRLRQAQEGQQQLAVLEAELGQRQQLLRGNAFLPEAREQLAVVEKRLRAVGYDEAQHRQLRERAAKLSGADQQRQLLEQARLATEHLQAQIGELGESLRRLEEQSAEEQQRLDRLCAAVRGLPDERERLAQLDAELVDARRQRDESRDQCMFAQSRLDNCAFLERKQKDSLAKQDALRREQSVFGDLVYAFGRRGVQAMIIETAIPEIEAEANRILARMTDGRMHVKFETQRDSRSGSGVIETLDIKIADELGTRSYELFSGGEGFRVNFAIRIALSRLLANRAGTRLQTLVVDEGFGSQDQDGRERIVEAIQSIQSEFEKILVITHLEDLRDRFPVRIEVTKSAAGSTYAVR
jgi:DNA repair protein SbcC/Rad50